jgi:uncharacterized protein involved in outer membrane biogenesis
MKKLIVRLVIVLVVVVILGVLAVGLALDGAIKRGVETIGPKLTKTDVRLGSVSLSVLSGSGTIKGLVVGNPEGFKTPSAISVGTASLSLVPGSLLADKIVVKSVHIQGPEITYETDLKGNNLSKLLANVDASTGGGSKAPSTPTEAKPAKKLQVDDFLISGGKIHVSVTGLGGASATVALPDIHLSELGKGPEGITPAELTKLVLQAIEKVAVQAASGSMTGLGKGSLDVSKQAGKVMGSDAEKVTKGIGDLLKKK